MAFILPNYLQFRKNGLLSASKNMIKPALLDNKIEQYFNFIQQNQLIAVFRYCFQ